MTEELKMPNMYMTPLGAVYNHLDSGAMQVIHGVRMTHLAGIYDRAQDDDFVVNLPINDTGEIVSRYIIKTLALYIDWIKVNAQIVDCWKQGIITTDELKNKEIVDILLQCGIAESNGSQVTIRNDFQWTSPTEAPHVIDITNEAIPIHKVKDE